MSNISVVVFGASGDLAKNKTYPALFRTFLSGHLPKDTLIVGYARTPISLTDFRARLSAHIKAPKGKEDVAQQFLERCFYVDGRYDQSNGFIKLDAYLNEREDSNARRILYFALPSTVFLDVAKNSKEFLSSKNVQIIAEKPFGMDYQSCKQLSTSLAQHWSEESEMVKNILSLRFANTFFGSVWSNASIDNVQITFKENIGTEGRGGYFDEFGIIRDVMQNHLLQVLSLIAMEKPTENSAESIRNEKVKVLECIRPLEVEETILGQYTASPDKKVPGYLDDPTVPKGSNQVTFAACVFHIDNDRWKGVPFIMKAGKALEEKKCEVRIQFKEPEDSIFPNAARNELVLRIQPNEAIYLKMNTKLPGLKMEQTISELDLTYKSRFADSPIPEAYEALLVDVLNNDHANFVRNDELDAAWKIFTPLLHKIVNIKPLSYPFGSRGPTGVDDFVNRYGYKRTTEYYWSPPKM